MQCHPASKKRTRPVGITIEQRLASTRAVKERSGMREMLCLSKLRTKSSGCGARGSCCGLMKKAVNTRTAHARGFGGSTKPAWEELYEGQILPLAFGGGAATSSEAQKSRDFLRISCGAGPRGDWGGWSDRSEARAENRGDSRSAPRGLRLAPHRHYRPDDLSEKKAMKKPSSGQTFLRGGVNCQNREPVKEDGAVARRQTCSHAGRLRRR